MGALEYVSLKTYIVSNIFRRNLLTAQAYISFINDRDFRGVLLSQLIEKSELCSFLWILKPEVPEILVEA